ncbi:MAG: 2-hydroxyacid dehydrogenase [Synergistaceae bacterium]|jgi:phosphoglycerate dehydrogenase-like enzyme|nr:2-hydroxyacid dehydrogenase [Synergistaceae bacterium]
MIESIELTGLTGVSGVSGLKVLFYSKEFVTIRDRLLTWAKNHEVDTADEETLAEKIVETDVLVTRPGALVSAELLDSAPKLKLWQQWGTGLDGLDFGACRQRGIAVCNTPSRGTGNAEGVAEIALLHMLLLGRKYAFAQQNIQAGRMFSPSGVSLWRKTVCVVGLGNLGQTLAERLAAMGTKLRGVNRTPVDSARLEKMGVKEFFLLNRLKEAVPGCRFVVAALALSDETRGFFDEDFFRSMDENAFFINVARGGLVREEALLRALDERRIAGAGLDVLADEPPFPGNPLLKHPSVTLTPHIGGVTDESVKGIFDFIQDNADRLSRGDPLLSRQD